MPDGHEEDRWYQEGGTEGEEARLDQEQERQDRERERQDVRRVPRSFSASCAACLKTFAHFTSDNAEPLGACPFCGCERVVYVLTSPLGVRPRPASPAEVANPEVPVKPSGRRTSPHRTSYQRLAP